MRAAPLSSTGNIIMTTNIIEPEAEDTEPEFRTRADAEAEIAAINEEIESLHELVDDDIERLEEQRAEIEEQLDDLPDEEEEKVVQRFFEQEKD
jgi:flagellar motility protein MotE (MotC chaperone)